MKPDSDHSSEANDASDSDLDAVEAMEASPSLPSATLAAGASRAAAEPRAGSRAGYFEIWTLSWPVMLAQLLANAVSLIDIAMVGRLGPNAVAAVGYATQFFFLSQSLLFAVGFACVALMARAIGAGNPGRSRAALAASTGISVASALLVLAVVAAAPESLLRALGADANVVTLTIPYLLLMLVSSIPLAVSMTLESGLRANRNTRTPMQIAVVVTVVKTVANFALIFGFPRLELVGAGLATLGSQGIGLALFWIVVMRERRDGPVAMRWADFVAARPLFGEVVRIALPSMGERLAMNLALLAYFRILAGFGTAAIAAYTVGIRVLAFSWIPGVGFGVAAATLVGQALGAGSLAHARDAGWRATRFAVVVAILFGIACALARHPLARGFTDDPATIAALGPFLLCLAFAQPFLQAHFALGGAHRGAGDTFTPFVAATLGNWGLRVPVGCLFALVWDLDLVWIWTVLVMDHAMRAGWLARSFQRGHWWKRLRQPAVRT